MSGRPRLIRTEARDVPEGRFVHAASGGLDRIPAVSPARRPAATDSSTDDAQRHTVTTGGNTILGPSR